MFNNKKRTCFIITPIGDEKDPIRREIEGIIDTVIEPVLGDGYTINVAHRIFEAGSINKQIIKLIYESDLVIANLTNRNPNVMYELAFRHTLGKPTIMMAKKDTELPFDILSERTIFYKNDLQGGKEAQEELKKYLSQIDYESGNTTGPIHDYLDSVELKKLIFSRNQNKNMEDILELILKRLEGIEDATNKARINPWDIIDIVEKINYIQDRLEMLSSDLYDPRNQIYYNFLNDYISELSGCKRALENLVDRM